MATVFETIRPHPFALPSSPDDSAAPSFNNVAVHVQDAFVLSFAIAKSCITRCEGALFEGLQNKRPSRTEYFSTGSDEKEAFGLWVMRKIFEPISRFLQLLRRDARLYSLAISSAPNFFRVLGLFTKSIPPAHVPQKSVVPYYTSHPSSKYLGTQRSIASLVDPNLRLPEHDL